MSITITVPNDDHVALRAMAKALEEIAVARGAPAQGVQVTMGKIDFNEPNPNFVGHRSHNAEADTTSQQVESLVDRVEDLLEVAEQPFQGEVMPATDSTGTPWDERIHSASKALNSDGTWRVRRKPKDMDETEWSDFVEMVKADLQYPVECGGQEREQEALTAIRKVTEDLTNGVPIGEAVAPLAEFEPSVTPAGDDFHVDTDVVTEQEVAAIPAPPPPPVANLQVGSPVPPAQTIYVKEEEDGTLTPAYTFPQVMKFLTERHARISSTQVEQIIREMGLTSIMDLNTQPEHTGPFIARVKAHLGE